MCVGQSRHLDHPFLFRLRLTETPPNTGAHRRKTDHPVATPPRHTHPAMIRSKGPNKSATYFKTGAKNVIDLSKRTRTNHPSAINPQCIIRKFKPARNSTFGALKNLGSSNKSGAPIRLERPFCTGFTPSTLRISPHKADHPRTLVSWPFRQIRNGCPTCANIARITDIPRGGLFPGKITLSIRSICAIPLESEATAADDKPGTLETPGKTITPARTAASLSRWIPAVNTPSSRTYRARPLFQPFY